MVSKNIYLHMLYMPYLLTYLRRYSAQRHIMHMYIPLGDLFI